MACMKVCFVLSCLVFYVASETNIAVTTETETWSTSEVLKSTTSFDQPEFDTTINETFDVITTSDLLIGSKSPTSIADYITSRKRTPGLVRIESTNSIGSKLFSTDHTSSTPIFDDVTIFTYEPTGYSESSEDSDESHETDDDFDVFTPSTDESSGLKFRFTTHIPRKNVTNFSSTSSPDESNDPHLHEFVSPKKEEPVNVASAVWRPEEDSIMYIESVRVAGSRKLHHGKRKPAYPRHREVTTTEVTTTEETTTQELTTEDDVTSTTEVTTTDEDGSTTEMTSTTEAGHNDSKRHIKDHVDPHLSEDCDVTLTKCGRLYKDVWAKKGACCAQIHRIRCIEMVNNRWCAEMEKPDWLKWDSERCGKLKDFRCDVQQNSAISRRSGETYCFLIFIVNVLLWLTSNKL